MTLFVHELTSRLAAPGTRGAEAERIAADVGTDAFLVLLYDVEVDAFRPAPGFPQTLPGGPLWSKFLKSRPLGGSFKIELPYPDRETLKPTWGYAQERAIFLFVGGTPRLPIESFGEAPLLPALLEAEAARQASSGLVRAAQDATHRATSLAAALDRARAEIGTKAAELARALAEADHLNQELTRFNETLEQRVADAIRDRMQVEEALRQAQKMEAIGQLTGGVAHDFNNLLTVIMGSLDSMRRTLEATDAAPDVGRLLRLQNMAFQGAERAATLTSRLLAFARRQPLDPKPINIDKLACALTDLLQTTLGETVALETVTTPGLWLAQADPAELESALLNLAINARDAMQEGGKLTIETSNAFLGEDYVDSFVEPVPVGQYVMVAVTDTGCGMDKNTLDRAVEPFFTTKDTSKGTGLGLSQVYGFVRQSGGHIRIYSEAGSGTTVKLYLPRADSDGETASWEARSVQTVDGGLETILVVEDHDGLREYSSGVLRELGYKVLEASDGAAALDLLRSREDVDLLFTDVVLPGMNGRQLADAALLARPDLKVLFTTGYTRNAIIHNGRLDKGVALITKPFTFAALAAKVRQILDR